MNSESVGSIEGTENNTWAGLYLNRLELRAGAMRQLPFCLWPEL